MKIILLIVLLSTSCVNVGFNGVEYVYCRAGCWFPVPCEGATEIDAQEACIEGREKREKFLKDWKK